MKSILQPPKLIFSLIDLNITLQITLIRYCRLSTHQSNFQLCGLESTHEPFNLMEPIFQM